MKVVYQMSRKREQVMKAMCLICMVALAMITGPAWAANPNIPPAMLAQLQNMSLADQAALAKQYGIDLPGVGGLGSQALEESVLGERGEEIELFDRVQQLQLETEIRQRLAEEQDEEDESDAELKRFGLELFDSEISTFAPVDSMPAPDGYRMGPGDTLNIYLYGNEDSDLTLAVNRDGQLVLPRLGPLSVSGLTFDQVKEVIDAKVASQLVGTKAVVSLGKLRAINVFLAGDVVAPGSYSVSGLATVLQVLYSGGGITEIGSLRNIEVKRRGAVVGTLDAYDILLRGDTSGDMRLASGDTVFVPTVKSLVSIDGEVKRPAIYEVIPQNSLESLLQMAGGLTASGYARSASIERRDPSKALYERLQVDLTDSKDLNMKLFNGDSLEVAAIKDEVSNQVTIRGAVARAGGYAWVEGMYLSDLLGNLDNDLLSDTDLSTGLIVRRTGFGLEIEALAFDLGKAIRNPRGEEDPILRSKDEVLVFALPYLNESYQKLVNANADDDAPALKGFEEGADGELILSLSTDESDEEKEKKEKRYEDRSALIEEVVFRLEAQAKTPASTQVVEIAGDVRLPGKYPLLEDRSIDALIALAGGFENSAYLASAEVTRVRFDATGAARISAFDIPLQQRDSGQSLQLEALDQIRISRIPNWSYGDAVELTGALLFPGNYPIVPGEMLSSVLNRAGGIAENGFPQGAVLIKREAKKREQEQLQRLIASIQRNTLAQSQTREQDNSPGTADAEAELEFLEKVLDSEAGGRVVIDLPAILAGDSGADIQLGAGDTLHVPEYNNTVSVIGEVRQPGTFQYELDRTVRDYVDLAAGNTVRADEKDTYVVRANGGVDRVSVKPSLISFTPSSAQTLHPGDTIVVPVDEEYQPVLTRYKEVSTVVFQSIASLYPLFRL